MRRFEITWSIIVLSLSTIPTYQQIDTHNATANTLINNTTRMIPTKTTIINLQLTNITERNSESAVVDNKASTSNLDPSPNGTSYGQLGLYKQGMEIIRKTLHDSNSTQEPAMHREENSDIDLEFDDYLDGNAPNQKDIDEAVEIGLKMMHDLHFVKEPKLYRMGLYLDENEAAGKMSMFSAPNPKAQIQARYGYATLIASARLREKYPETRSRQNPENVAFLRTSVLSEQCPLRGIPRCPPASRRYRTADGTCNNLEHPWKGASMLPMQRFLLPMYDDQIQSVRRSVRGNRLPSAREISIRIHRDRDIETPSITMMFMQWGQFLDHDITSTAQSRAFNGTIPRCCARGGTGFLPPEFMHPDCLPISVPEEDWFLSRFGIKCIEFVRSAPSSRIDCDLGWREQINQVTSYLDASTVYGSDAERADSLRIFRNGLMQYGRPRGSNEPPDPPDGEICRLGAVSTQCFKGGDNRVGEQPGLTAFHTVWLRYHNRLAVALNNMNPHWSDEKIYQEARRIVGAMIQQITYKEFLPVVLGHEVMDLFNLNLERKGFYNGYDAKINPTPANGFSSAAFRFGHSLVQNTFVRSDSKHRPMFNNVSIHEEQKNPENIWSFGSVDRLILGFCNQASQRRDEYISKELTNHLFQTSNQPFGMDLAAVNIQRGRDHGIPSYTSWREPCGLSEVRTWSDLEPLMPFETVQRFRSIYEHVDDIDLYPGGLAERPVRGGVVGPTFACIIAQQFSNIRKGDRFWYENGGFESSFTPAQLQQIRKITFSHILCQVLPEIETIQPFVFLSADNFRNSRLTCDSPELNNFDLRAWEERKNNFQNVDRNVLNNKIDFEAKENKINNKLDFGNKNKNKTASLIKDKLDNKLDFGNTNKINDKLSFEESKLKPNKLVSSTIKNKTKENIEIEPQVIVEKLDFNEVTTPKIKDKIDVDFDVLFFTSNKGIKKKKPEKNLDLDVDKIFDTNKKKRSILSEFEDYYDLESRMADDDEDDEEDEDYEEDGDKLFSRKSPNKKKKKRPLRRGTSTARSTTRRATIYIQNRPVNSDFYNPVKIHVTNITTHSYDINDNPNLYKGKPVYEYTTRRPHVYDDDEYYVLHPTVTKATKKKNRYDSTQKADNYQVNINIQYLGTTPKTDIQINKVGRPNVHIIEDGYYNDDSHKPLPVIPIRTTKRPTYNYVYSNTNRPGYYDGPSTYKIRPYDTSTRPYYSEPIFVTSRPYYNYDKFEDRPFSTSKRPYIYKPSESYLAMFDEMHTTRRPTYITSYVDKVTKRPNIPSYLYLTDSDKYYKDERISELRDVYKQLMQTSTVHPNIPEEPIEESYEEDYDTSPGGKNFVKISSVQGKRFLIDGSKEQIINTAQQKEGDLELFDEEILDMPTEKEIEKVQVDVIPRENRKDDWLFFNEIKDDKNNIDIPEIKTLTNDTTELPKPIVDFWNRQEDITNKTGRNL